MRIESDDIIGMYPLLVFFVAVWAACLVLDIDRVFAKFCIISAILYHMILYIISPYLLSAEGPIAVLQQKNR